MRSLISSALAALPVGYVMAHYLILLFNNWYFTQDFWLKVGLLTPVCAGLFMLMRLSNWRRIWTILGIYWVAVHLISLAFAGGWSLEGLSFVGVLNFEAVLMWPTLVVIVTVGIMQTIKASRDKVRMNQSVNRQLRLRRKLRRRGRTAAVLLALSVCIALVASPHAAYADESVGDPYIPPTIDVDRHSEFWDGTLRIAPQMPDLPGVYPTPMHLRSRETFWIVIENWADGMIRVCEDPAGGYAMDGVFQADNAPSLHEVGKVLAPVANINKRGFTASGWAEPGTVCASAVNAIHLKTDHNYTDGRGVIFSLVPVEFATFDPKDYLSYFNQSSSLFTDIPAGSQIFGGRWAPLTGSRIMKLPPEGTAITDAVPVDAGWVPAKGEVIVIEVNRRRYNPEYIEFENGFGGLIQVKEIGLEPYPIGQVLKPVAGVGRFLGTQYAETGRIRAAHPGVICVSTSPMNVVGGFQIIPRDHAMSPEMTYTRVKTQWMVVGPLWALDPSWEGLPPLFTDYLYPAYTPAFNADGTQNEDTHGAETFLNRFTVRGRYRDNADPEEYILLREGVYLDNTALQDLTHLRIYFPRD